MFCCDTFSRPGLAFPDTPSSLTQRVMHMDNTHSPSADANSAILAAVNTAARLLQEARAVDSFGSHYYDDALDTDYVAHALGEILSVDLTNQGDALRDWLEENPNRSEVRLVAWVLTVGQAPLADFDSVFRGNVDRVNNLVTAV